MALVSRWTKTQTFLSRKDMYLALKWALALSKQMRLAEVKAGRLPAIPPHDLYAFLAVVQSKSCELDDLTGEEEPFAHPPLGHNPYGSRQAEPSQGQVKQLESQQAIKDMLTLKAQYKKATKTPTPNSALANALE